MFGYSGRPYHALVGMVLKGPPDYRVVTWSDQVKSFSLWALPFIFLALIQEPMEQLFFQHRKGSVVMYLIEKVIQDHLYG